MKHKLAIAFAYNTQRSKTLNDVIDHHIEQITNDRFITSASLVIQDGDSSQLATSFYGPVYYEVEGADIVHGYIWDNETASPQDIHPNAPLISAGDMETTRLHPHPQHRQIHFSLHKYHRGRPGGRPPLSREQIQAGMCKSLDELRSRTLAQYRQTQPAALFYSEVQASLQQHQCRITKIVFNTEEGLSRYPFKYLFRTRTSGRGFRYFHNPTMTEFYNFNLFQAALAAYKFDQDHINRDGLPLPIYVRTRSHQADRKVILRKLSYTEVIQKLAEFQTRSDFTRSFTTSSDQEINLRRLILQDMRTLPQLIDYYTKLARQFEHYGDHKEQPAPGDYQTSPAPTERNRSEVPLTAPHVRLFQHGPGEGDPLLRQREPGFCEKIRDAICPRRQ